MQVELTSSRWHYQVARRPNPFLLFHYLNLQVVKCHAININYYNSWFLKLSKLTILSTLTNKHVHFD